MLTRIEITGFKTFEDFTLNLRPFSAVVGPNASGKSNLFDALKFLSALAQNDIRTAMQSLRGEPQELFRQTADFSYPYMIFTVEVLLDQNGVDAFGTTYSIRGQRLRYEIMIELRYDIDNNPTGIFVIHEECRPLYKKDETAEYLIGESISYSPRSKPFINMRDVGYEPKAFEIRQDGPAGNAGATKRGRPLSLPAVEATRSALSTITTAEFPHLYALRDMFSSIRFLEINPQAARQPSDRFESKLLKSDASNLAAVLAKLRDETRTEARPEGAIADISNDLSFLIPSVDSVKVFSSGLAKEYSFGVKTTSGLEFSSRVISDGTLRLLALLALLDDPKRKGILCFEEPENGVHEGRIDSLIKLLRAAVSTGNSYPEDQTFQIIINTHSPAVMSALEDQELIAADAVTVVDPEARRQVVKTRMRTGVAKIGQEKSDDMLTRYELEHLLRHQSSQV